MKNKSYRQQLLPIIFLSILFIFFFIFVFGVFVVVILNVGGIKDRFLMSKTTLQSETVDDEVSSLHFYQFLQVDNDVDVNEMGIAVVNADLVTSGEKKIDYSTRDAGGNFNLVSNFGKIEWVCTTTCICEDFEEDFHSDRRYLSAVAKPILVLVAAISSTIAMNLAREMYVDECDFFGDVEGCISVISEGEVCREVFKKERAIDEKREKKKTKKEEKVLHAFVAGVVQGVFFREFTKRQVGIIGEITGFVRNLRDGRVELYGESRNWAKLEMLLDYLHRGPTSSRVDAVDYDYYIKKSKFIDFVVLPTV